MNKNYQKSNTSKEMELYVYLQLEFRQSVYCHIIIYQNKYNLKMNSPYKGIKRDNGQFAF